jgi:carbon monoxide dehydrogenase subunit G
MTDLSQFRSRTGRIHSSADDIFSFVTDIRNFEQFAPSGTISNWQAGKESCSFSVSMLGTVSFRLTEKVSNSKVVFEGDALKKNDFTIVLSISEAGNENSEVIVNLDAELNPMMKMMAANPIKQFLEMLVKEMEDFKGWKGATG